MKILLTADLHLREDRPICRKDEDWFKSQEYDLNEIKNIAEKESVDQVWVLGDIFHTPTVPAKIVNLAIDSFNAIAKSGIGVKLLAGNHDLPYHNVELIDKCSLGILNRSFNHIESWGNLKVEAYDFGTENPSDTNVNTVCIHRLIFPSEKRELAKLSGACTTENLIDEFPNVKNIFMGDYHEGYIETIGNTNFVMPGCVNIQSGALADYIPHVVIWNTEDNSFKQVNIDNPLAVITTEHLIEAEERDERLKHCIDVATGSLKKEFDFVGELKTVAYNLGISEIADEMLTNLNVN